MHHMLDARLQNRSNMKDRPWPFVVIFVWQFVAQFLFFVQSAQNFTNALIELQHKFTDYSAFYAFLRWFVVYCVRQCVYVLIFFFYRYSVATVNNICRAWFSSIQVV